MIKVQRLMLSSHNRVIPVEYLGYLMSKRHQISPKDSRFNRSKAQKMLLLPYSYWNDFYFLLSTSNHEIRKTFVLFCIFLELFFLSLLIVWGLFSYRPSWDLSEISVLILQDLFWMFLLSSPPYQAYQWI